MLLYPVVAVAAEIHKGKVSAEGSWRPRRGGIAARSSVCGTATCQRPRYELMLVVFQISGLRQQRHQHIYSAPCQRRNGHQDTI